MSRIYSLTSRSFYLFPDPGWQGALCVLEGCNGGAVLRHHLLRPRGGGRGYAAQGQGGKALRTKENIPSGKDNKISNSIFIAII